MNGLQLNVAEEKEKQPMDINGNLRNCRFLFYMSEKTLIANVREDSNRKSLKDREV